MALTMAIGPGGYATVARWSMPESPAAKVVWYERLRARADPRKLKVEQIRRHVEPCLENRCAGRGGAPPRRRRHGVSAER
jgi:hypothetical protein